MDVLYTRFQTLETTALNEKIMVIEKGAIESKKALGGHPSGRGLFIVGF